MFKILKPFILCTILLSTLLAKAQDYTYLQFDGIDDQAKFEAPFVDIGFDNFTLEAEGRFTFAASSFLPTILSNKGDWDWNKGYSWAIHKSNFPGFEGESHIFRIEDITYHLFIPQNQTNDHIFDGNCHNLLVSRKGSNIIFYIDGKRFDIDENVDPSTLNMTNNHPHILGFDNHYDATSRNSYLTGSLRGIRAWNNAYTAAQIEAGVGTSFWLANLDGQVTFSDIQANTNPQYISGDLADVIRGTSTAVENNDPSLVQLPWCGNGDIFRESQEISNNSTIAVNNPAGDFLAIEIPTSTSVRQGNSDYIQSFLGNTTLGTSANSESTSNDETTVEVYNLNGELQMTETVEKQQKTVILNSSELNSGIYILKINANNKIYTERIIKS